MGILIVLLLRVQRDKLWLHKYTNWSKLDVYFEGTTSLTWSLFTIHFIHAERAKRVFNGCFGLANLRSNDQTEWNDKERLCSQATTTWNGISNFQVFQRLLTSYVFGSLHFSVCLLDVTCHLLYSRFFFCNAEGDLCTRRSAFSPQLAQGSINPLDCVTLHGSRRHIFTKRLETSFPKSRAPSVLPVTHEKITDSHFWIF